MNRILRKILCFAVVIGMLVQSGLVYAKSETVYLLLGRDGALNKTIVVNSFSGDNESIVDYGDYENIINLSSSAVPKIEGDKIVFHREGDDNEFYYRGDLKNVKNPWNIEIKYLLNGVETAPESLFEASGDFEMIVRVSPAEKGGFADKYTVQMQGSIIGAKEISADGASIVAMGSQYTVGAIFLPGKEHEVRIGAKIDGGLELGAFTFTGVKAALDFDIDFDEVERQVGSLEDASAQVLAGIVRLEGGARELSSGISAISGNLGYISSNSSSLKKGVSDAAEAFKALDDAASRLPMGSAELLGAVKSANEKFLSVKDMAGQLLQAPDPNMAALGAVLLGQLELNGKVIEALAAINAGEAALAGGVKQLGEGFEALSGGAVKLIDGIEAISAGSARVSEGAAAYSAGFSELIEGQKSFVVGVGEAKEQLSDMLSVVRGADNAKAGSFVSSKNSVESVTFIMRTEELRKPEIEKEPLPPLPKKNMWQKLLNLFGME